MKIVYIAHPISGDIEANINSVVDICESIHTKEVVPIAPYLLPLTYLDDNNPEHRALGIAGSNPYFTKKFTDEVWLYGDRISNGMKAEIELARKHNIPVFAKTSGTQKDLDSDLQSGV